MASSAADRLRGLYAITPEDADTESLVARVASALEGGAAIVQYRAKTAAPALALAQSRRLAALCKSFGALYIVNDSIELASASGADMLAVISALFDAPDIRAAARGFSDRFESPGEKSGTPKQRAL